MASQIDAPPAPQPIQRAEDGPRPSLQQGYIQNCEGYLHRKTKILKRWKKEWLKVVTGKKSTNVGAGLQPAYWVLVSQASGPAPHSNDG